MALSKILEARSVSLFPSEDKDVTQYGHKHQNIGWQLKDHLASRLQKLHKYASECWSLAHAKCKFIGREMFLKDNNNNLIEVLTHFPFDTPQTTSHAVT